MLRLFMDNLILNEKDLTQEEVEHINPTGEEEPETKQEEENNTDNNDENTDIDNNSDDEDTDNLPSMNEEDDDTSVDDEDDSNDTSEYTEVDPDSIQGKIKELQDQIDKDLITQDKILRKKRLFELFDHLYKSLEYIQTSLTFYFNTAQSRENKYNEIMSELDEVIKNVYYYITNLYNNKSYIESKCFFSDVYIYILELNNVISTLKINQNIKK